MCTTCGCGTSEAHTHHHHDIQNLEKSILDVMTNMQRQS